MLKRSMRRIERDGIKNLIVDLGINPGGMQDNIYKTLGYFTDKPIDMANTYYIDDENRELVQTIISNGLKDKINGISKSERERLSAFVGTLPSGTVFNSDTLFKIEYLPPADQKYRFRGNVYLLTANLTYSAAQLFVQYFKNMDLGQTAGQPCGGYKVITGGNAYGYPLPRSGWMSFQVPFSTLKLSKDEPYEYNTVDIPIDYPFSEWINGENNSRERLVEMIRAGRAPDRAR